MRRPAAGGFLPDDAFRALKRLVVERTGHFYYEDKDELLWERVKRRISALRLADTRAYLARLTDPDRGEAEWIALEGELTIGETFFFRYVEQFDALRKTILPGLIAANAETRRLRIWSAGCAIGAEPYSLAILVDELLGDRLPDWRVTILGTDINESFLEQARTAEFGTWALRSLGREDRDRWFDDAGERRWRLKAKYRGMVRFQRGNLLDLLGPAPPLEFDEFDLILCRNVLIYFHSETVIALAGALASRLRPEGWLLVGHAEPNPDFAKVAHPVSLPGTAAYRPLGTESPAPPEPLPPLFEPRPAYVPPVLPPAPLPPPLRPAPLTPPAAAATTSVDDLLDEIRRRADLGDYAGAASRVAEGLAQAPQDARLHFYDGLIHQARGQLASAEDGFRRAAYLDPSFIMAHYHLGLVRMERGRTDAGRRAIAAAAQIAGTMSANERLAEGAGLTAADLRDSARLQLELRAPGA